MTGVRRGRSVLANADLAGLTSRKASGSACTTGSSPQRGRRSSRIPTPHRTRAYVRNQVRLHREVQGCNLIPHHVHVRCSRKRPPEGCLPGVVSRSLRAYESVLRGLFGPVELLLAEMREVHRRRPRESGSLRPPTSPSPLAELIADGERALANHRSATSSAATLPTPSSRLFSPEIGISTPASQQFEDPKGDAAALVVLRDESNHRA